MTAFKTYQGVEIEVSDRGKFTATVKGKYRTAASLAAMEKVIRESAIEVPAWYGDGGKLRAVTVTGKGKNGKKGYGVELQAVGGNSWGTYYVGTPEQAAAHDLLLSEQREMIIRHNRERADMDERIRTQGLARLTEEHYDAIVAAARKEPAKP